MASRWANSVLIWAAILLVFQTSDSNSADDTIISLHNDNIVKISRVCPERVGSRGYVEVTSDMSMYVVGVCSNGVHNFTRIDRATQRLILDLEAGDLHPDLCSLYKREKSETYTFLLRGGWGEHGREVMIPELRQTILCAYDNYTLTEKQNPVNVKDYIIAPQDLPSYKGPMLNLKIDMSLVNIVGANLDGKETNLGKLVRLRALSLDQRAPIKPISCFASNDYGKKYYIIRAGCGDGLVFDKTVGFKYDSVTRTSWSPYFRSFTLPRSRAIFFMCHFVICNDDCGVDSCTNERKKRDMAHRSGRSHGEYNHATTATGYVIVRKVNVNDRSLSIADFRDLGRRRLSNRRNESAYAKVYVVLGVLGAMLLVTMCMLLAICVRQAAPLQSPNSLPNAKPSQELNNIASA